MMIPELPPEIIQKIISNLNLVDLLNCRLICSSWNKESLMILNDSSYNLALDEENIEDYLEFTKTSSPQFIIPFYLSFSMISKPYGYTPRYEQNTEERFNKFVPCVDALLKHFGVNCVRKLCFFIKYESDKVIPKFFKLLSKISTGLVTLHLNLGERYNPNLFLKNCDKLYLPKLSKWALTSKASTDIWDIFADKCPNLTEFEGCYSPWYESSCSGMDLTKLVHLDIKSLPLRKFATRIQMSPSPPILRSLSMHLFFQTYQDVEDFKYILTSLSSTLKSLDLRLYFGYDTSIDRILFPPSTLPNLTWFGIESRMDEFFPLIVIDHSAIPSLEGMGISYNLNLKLANADDVTNPFPKVKFLKFYIYGDTPYKGYQCPDSQFKNHMNYFLQIFPNVTGIAVKNKDAESSLEGRVYPTLIKYVIRGIIQYVGASKVQKFDLECCDQNYLAHVLDEIRNENPKDKLKMINVKNVGLKYWGWPRLENNCRGVKSSKHVAVLLSADILAQNLPTLEEIQVSSFMFGNDKNIRVQVIRQFYKKFRNIVIDLINE